MKEKIVPPPVDERKANSARADPKNARGSSPSARRALNRSSKRRRSRNARSQLLDAALKLIREQGLAATSVDELCAAAGVTKGAFFHHFESKEALAVAAADHWSETTGALFASAPYHEHEDPLDRFLAYLDFRKELVRGPLPEFTCLVGTMVQEAYGASDDLRDACRRSIEGHAATLEADIEAATSKYGVHRSWTARSLAQFTQAALQGGFILAKAANNPAPALDAIDHLKRYAEQLFGGADKITAAI
jgi:TetR/AcrR family transcriptional repressor of nem operon